MPTLSPEQRHVLGEIQRIGRRRHESRKELEAAVATGLVENNLTNRKGGDADSSGWRQERRSIYRDPDNLRASINRFFDETSAVEDKYKNAGALAAAVQRPAAQYRGRYAERLGEARSLLGGGGGSGAHSPITIDVPQLTESFDQEGYDTARRRAVVGAFIAKRNPNSLLLKAGALSATAPDMADFKTSEVTTSTEAVRAGSAKADQPVPGGGTGSAQRAAAEAAKRLGVSEDAGSNRGRKLDTWEQKYGMLGQPWCGIFVGLSLEKAGVKGITSRVASVAAIEEDARAGRNGFASWHSPRHAQVGDALVTGKGQHVGLVVAVKNGVIHTIEGNTGNGRVERRTHSMDSVYGVARPRHAR